MGFREIGPLLGLLPGAQETPREGMREKLSLRFGYITCITSYCLKQRQKTVIAKSMDSGDRHWVQVQAPSLPAE